MGEQIDQIMELFAPPRGQLELVVKMGGINIYTSPTLKQNFIKAMAKTSRVAPIVKTLEKLINKGEFFPCYLTDKISRSLLRRQPPEFKGFAGTTFGKYILVYVENEANIFGFASNNELSITTLHELIHRASNEFPTQFLNMFMSELTIYYHFYWSKIFSLEQKKVDVKKIKEIISFIYRFKRDNKGLVTYHKLLTEAFKDASTLEAQVFDKLVQQYIVMIKIIWKAMDSHTPDLIEKTTYANRHFISPLYTAYKMTFGINVKHMKELCYQELYSPSEIIAIPALVKQPNPKVYNIVNKL